MLDFQNWELKSGFEERERSIARKLKSTRDSKDSLHRKSSSVNVLWTKEGGPGELSSEHYLCNINQVTCALCRHLTAKEDYAKFYDLDSSEEEDDEKEKLKAKPSKKKEVAKKNRDNTSEEDSDIEDERVPEGSEESEDDDVREGKAAELEPEIVAKLRDDSVDYARGELHFDLLIQF